MASDMVNVPWTPDQVASLNAFQQCDDWHPFTCANGCGDQQRHRVLIARVDGWQCPICDYRQAWAHGFMADWRWMGLAPAADAGEGRP